MSQNPFMQLYVGDYLADTLDLTTEQHGAYLLLLMTMWRHDARLPNDPSKLARIARVSARRWHLVWSEIQHFFYVDGDDVRNKRLDREHQKAVSISEKRSASGAAGGRAKALRDKETPVANATDLPQHSQISDIREEKNHPSDGAADAAPADPVGVMFNSGRKLLMAAGKSKDQSGKILGKWRADYGTEAVITALGEAQREGAIDPVSFIEACLRNSKKRKARQTGEILPFDAECVANPICGEKRRAKSGVIKQYAGYGVGWIECH